LEMLVAARSRSASATAPLSGSVGDAEAGGTWTWLARSGLPSPREAGSATKTFLPMDRSPKAPVLFVRCDTKHISANKMSQLTSGKRGFESCLYAPDKFQSEQWISKFCST